MKPSAKPHNFLTYLLPMMILGCVSPTAKGQGQAPSEPGGITVRSVAVNKAPEIDGRDNDEVWRHTPGTRIMVREVSGDRKGRTSPVIIKSVRTTTHIFFLVSWADATHDATHKTWVWSAEKKTYGQGGDREDVLALAFEHRGVFNVDMLSGVEAVWDVWQWKAARTDPAGYAMDKTHRSSKTKTAGKAKSFKDRSGSTIWIARPEDEGESPQKSQPAPAAYRKDRVPQYVAGRPSGSAADIRAKGLWRDGLWMVEFARKLSTGYADDTAFDARRTYRMGLAVFDREEHIHHSTSEVIQLTLDSASLPSGHVVRAYVTNFGGNGVSVIDPVKGRLVGHIRTGNKPHGVAIAPDGKAVYVSNEGDGTLSVIDPIKNEVVATIQVGKGPNQVEVSADGRYVFATLHEDGAVTVVDVSTRKVAKVVRVGRAPHIALRSPDGKTIFVTCEGDMKLVALDAQTWKVTAETPLLAFPRVLAVTPDGKRLYQTIRWLNGVLVVDPRQKKVVDRIALGEPIFAAAGKDAHGIALTPDGSQLWLTTQTTNDVTIFDSKDHRIIGRVFVGGNPNWVDFTPDGKLAVVSNTSTNDVSVVDVAQRKVVATVKVGPSPKRLAVGAVTTGTGRRTGQSTFPFDDVAEGKLPQGWKIEATNSRGRLAGWAVAKDAKAASKPHVLSLSKVNDTFGGVFNLCWSPAITFKDGEIEVKVRANSGWEDQGGGPIWRARDANNYYIARYNPLERNFRVYFVKDGARRTLASARGIRVMAGEWFTIKIVHKGEKIEGWLNGKKLLEATDRTFREAGGVGFWTKADAVTSFDDLLVRHENQ